MWILALLLSVASGVEVKDLIQKVEHQSMGDSFVGHLKMSVKRPEGQRDLEIQSWAEGRDKALVKVLKPEKDRGTANLRLEYNLWQYLPKIERTIKVPPSLMLQSWMGSDFTNDDLVKTSRLSRDYDCKFEKDDVIDKQKVVQILCTPKPDAPVVWGKLQLWIEPTKAVLLAQDFYTENGEKVKELRGTRVKAFGSHTLASLLTMKTLKKNTSTTLEYLDAKFDGAIDKNVFTQSRLQAPIKE
jgi:hypothetical protein